MIPEPALRPAAGRGSGLELCHTSRLHLEGTDLVLHTRRRSLRLPVGAGGITRAVFVDAPGADRQRMGPPVTGSWGEVQLQDESGALRGWFDIEDWLPESPALPKRSVQGDQLLSRSGVSALCRAAGIPLHVVRSADDPRAAKGKRRRGSVRLARGGDFPAWYWGTRLAAGGVWFTAFTVIVFSGSLSPWLVVPSAVAAFVAPVARLALRLRTRMRLRRYDPVVRERVRPAPADGLGATVRFRRDTELRVQDRDLVLRYVGGQEYWLPLTGPHALTTLVLVRDRTGAPVGAELRGPGEELRAVLPWDAWFGGTSGTSGTSGADGWARLRKAAGTAGLRATERELSGKAAWPKHPALGAGPLPASPRAARRESRFAGTVAGVSSTAVMALASYFSIAWGMRMQEAHPAAAPAVIALGALGAVLQAIPYLAHQLHSRFRLDRPADPAPDRPLTEQAA
ncbi:hypothetical protein ACFY1J_37410 [Streptomyces sp. NPDC001406]|uniref:hypothetical protein n=1 Tax=Streptomyces sp. NPDC001406 TaxID=3364572 RepID=UPI0036AAF283